MDILYTGTCRYEFQEQKGVPVWYTGIYRPISSTASKQFLVIHVDLMDVSTRQNDITSSLHLVLSISQSLHLS
jgi:hypothetical protein